MRRVAGPALAAVTAAVAAAAAAHAAPDAQRGQAAFEDRCASCHQVDDAGQGPSLAGVFGRKAAADPGFAYSAALKASGLTWTPAALERFLAGPKAAVPGTAMPVAVGDAGVRADVIAYLKTLKGR